jgi:hypothetical protein
VSRFRGRPLDELERINPKSVPEDPSFHGVSPAAPAWRAEEPRFMIQSRLAASRS